MSVDDLGDLSRTVRPLSVQTRYTAGVVRFRDINMLFTCGD